DPPEHTIFRRLLNPIFNARRISALGPMIEGIVNRQIDTLLGRESGDFYEDFAAIVPIYAIEGLLGVDPERHEDFRDWVADYIRCMQTMDTAGEAEACDRIWGYFRDRMDQRQELIDREGRDAAPDDVVTLLLVAEHPDGRRFRDDELKILTALLLAGGTDT